MGIKFVGSQVTFQEVPDEVSLTLLISNCPRRCKNCHSPELREDIGEELTADVLKDLINKNLKHITCVCFLGGEQHPEEITKLFREIRANYPGMKIALYTGADFVPNGIASYLDYVKLGPYIEEYGPLTSKTTNQILLERDGFKWFDVTHKFWEDYNED